MWNLLRPLHNLLLKKGLVIPQHLPLHEIWRLESQPSELEYHIHSEWRHSGDFWLQTQELFEAFGFAPDDYVGKTVLDLGAGSQLRTKYFKNCTLIALEPLGEQFLNKVSNCDLTKADRLIVTPAEIFQSDLAESIDFCISINVLDHCYDFKAICQNIFTYLKNGGTAFFSFDEHDGEADPLHPLALNQQECADLLMSMGFIIDKMAQGFPESFKANRKVNTYGHGKYCLNFWLTKP